MRSCLPHMEISRALISWSIGDPNCSMSLLFVEERSLRLETELERYGMYETNRNCPKDFAWVTGPRDRTALLAPMRLDIKFPAMSVAPLATYALEIYQ